MRSTMPLLAVALILAANACAQIDVDPNGVGIYFDQAATQTSADSGIPVPPDAATVQAWLIATRARNALVLVRGKPTDQLPGPGRQLNAVAVAAGWHDDDGGEFLNHYLRVTRRAKAVVNKVFGD